ncbi:hypothetical protein AGDE_11208 [Angomonas deanei]|uniref:Flagellar attachment zone protein 1 conserved domain-containing protein n=1 Tax=Angomonas deanei TaxID=59799 RepID=A0A7G2CKV0_9TRYP|nr:hypothetical protein AGDE_11208 [Angomonas deanei]CAD2218842.1 hypothetical protein, conserved [Angomonas deanei]|eukprot:EPY26558.1 hypothetical protein AGDE_11208 [Angomonas deanei]
MSISAQQLEHFMLHDDVVLPVKTVTTILPQETPYHITSATTTTVRLTKKFEGDNWKDILPVVPRLLKQTFISEASAALNVPEKCISEVQFRLGSLYVTFHVTHDEDVSEEEMERRIEEYPFREMWRLYNQRDAPPDGLDAALAEIKKLEEQLKQKEEELERQGKQDARRIADLEKQLEDVQRDLEDRAEEREKDLLAALATEQASRKEADGRLKDTDEQNKKLTEQLKKEKNRFEKQAQRQNELIAAIIQENKKEKEAKEREYNEALEVKDYIIETLKEQLRSLQEDGASPRGGLSQDQSAEFDKLMGRMEEMALILQQTQQSETEARAEIRRLQEELTRSEEGRHADNVTYENDKLALKQQLKAFTDSKLAEDHNARAAQRRGSNVAAEIKENETIVRQYETALENIIGTLQDRLNILQEEFGSFLRVNHESMQKEKELLQEHEGDSNQIRETFRTQLPSLTENQALLRPGGGRRGQRD